MDSITQRQIDLASREKIIHDIDNNYFVEAGAGSGKTTVLVERMVAMIESGRDISKISAITFTKAAANEFYARFQKRLIERSNEKTDSNYIYSPTKLKNPSDETRENCKKALQNIDLAFMGTIDSFCNMVMSEHPQEGLIPSNASVISNDEAEELYKREYARILNGEYNNPILEEKAKRFQHYIDKDADSFITILKLLLSHRDCKLVIPNEEIKDLDEKYAIEKKTISKIVDILADKKNIGYFNMTDKQLEPLLDSFKKYKHIFNSKRSWEDNVNNLLTAFNKTFGYKDFRLRLDESIMNELGVGSMYFDIGELRKKPAFYAPNERLLDIPKTITNYKYQVALDFVENAKEEILKVLRDEGKLTFNDYLIYLRDTLRKDAQGDGKLIKHIYDRHSYFMIDEFQDTDPVQSEIFFYLSAKEIKADWKKCVPHPGSLFIVGDPKQSIYRFKNADVASFLNIRKMFEDKEVGEVLNLFCNFRSTYEIRDYFNTTFEPLLKDTNDQAAYPLIPLDESEKKNDFTGIFQYEYDKDILDEYKVKDIILKLVHNPNYLVQVKEFINDKEQLVFRQLEWKDFMIITKSKEKLADYTSLFRTVGIPYYVEGNINFDECPSFKELVKIYGGVTMVSDNRCFYGALKSKLFNVTQKDLIEARENKYRIDIKTDISELKLNDNLKNAINTLQDLSSLALGFSPSTLFLYLIEKMNVFKFVGNKNMEYLYFALELLKSKETTKEVCSHLDAYNMFLNLLSKESEQERCPGLSKDGNQVHLANLHKVKGLEAPIVILASPVGKAGDQADFRMVRQDKENLGYVFEVNKKLGKGSQVNIIKTDNNEELKEEEIESVRAEKLRLEYVAATRARNVLIIASRKSAKGQYVTNPWKDLLGKDYPDIEDKLKAEPIALTNKNVVSLEDIKETESVIRNEFLKEESYKSQSPSSLTTSVNLQVTLDDDEREIKQKEESSDDTLATATGTMVHRLMELMINSKDRFNKNELIKTILDENAKNVNKFLEVNFFDLLSRIYDTMHSGGYSQVNGAIDDILPVLLNAEEVYSEVPFTYKEGNVIWNGIIDLMYKKDGKYHIIDWKTNKTSEGLSEHYMGQLEAYKNAIFKSSSIVVEDALIYHIDLSI